MNRRLLGRLASIATALAIGGAALAPPGASAAFPNFSGCVRTGTNACFNVQARSGSMTIKGFAVPLGESLEIRGALRDNGDGTNTFVPPAGTNGVFGRPVQVPGGLLGIDLPFWINEVQATPVLAGPASAVRINTSDFSVRLPLKLELSNPVLGPFCQIGSNSSPANLSLITGTTNPPAPNRPISGRLGTGGVIGNAIVVTGNTHVDNSFSIPSAQDCGYWPAGVLVDLLVNAKLRIPSAGGNNTMIVNNDLALQFH